MVKQEVPSWAKKYLKPDAFADVLAAVMNAETKTSAEIVPMVVRRSTTSGHLVTIAMLIGLCGVYLLLRASEGDVPWWAGALVILCGFSPIAFPAFMLRQWTTAIDLDAQVGRRALVEFYQAGLVETAGKTGILLFVSLDEHRVVVLADKAISDKLPPETWQGVVQTIIGSIKGGDLSRGLAVALADCAKLLAPHFPKAHDDQNELKDRLIVKE